MAKRGRPQHVSPDMVAEAATELFLEQGYHRTSVDDIATRSGISRATFFNYFPNKADVLFREIDNALDDVARLVDGGTSPRDAIVDTARHLGREHLPIIATHADTMRASDDIARLGPARVERLRAIIAQKHPDPFDHWVMTAAVVSACLGWATGDPGIALEAEIERALGRLRGDLHHRSA